MRLHQLLCWLSKYSKDLMLSWSFDFGNEIDALTVTCRLSKSNNGFYFV